MVLLGAALCAFAGALAPEARGVPSDYIRSSCRATQYPHLCERCLSAYAPPVRRSPRGVAAAALASGAVQDCMETMRDSVDRLRRSVQEMKRMGRARSPRFAWHLSNVQTWVSAALTDEGTCLDSLSQNAGPAVRAAIRKRVVEVAHVTSNALALVNRLSPRI
ncbi:21 kDa protein [Musa troglodytarum]|uniref:21 kDa protein n=1 Tax=Musa troglodytarum TaxID=320322 RepID=A0A9E7JID4_9LILI|nr:21 kDa protein [Musa troglodytarum]